MDISLLTTIKCRKKRILKENDDSTEIISKIKETLSGNKFEQAYGCCLLHVILSKCDEALFEDNALSWIRLVMKYLNTSPLENNINLCYEIISTVLDKSVNFDKLARDIGTKGIDVIFSFILGSSVPVVVNTFSLISCCIKRYPNSCGRFRHDLNKLIAKHILSHDRQISTNACYCLTLVPISGSGGEKKKLHKENWYAFLTSVLVTAHHNCVLFTNVVCGKDLDENISYGEVKILEFELSSNLCDHKTKSKLHLEKCLVILKTMLSNSLGFDVQVPISLLVRLFCEVADLCNIERGNEIREEHTSVTIRDIMEHLLSLVSACLTQFSSHFIPYFSFIVKVFSSVLSAQCMFDRSAIYSCFTNAVYQWKVIPGSSKLLQEFFEYIIRDIQTGDKNNADVTDKQMLPTKKTRKKVKTHSQRFQEDLDNYHVKNQINVDIHQRKNSYHALVALRQCVLNLGPVLPAKMLEMAISCVLQTLQSIYSWLKFPYDCQKNRMQLYKVVFSLLNLNHDRVVLPRSILLSFLRIGATDSDGQVRKYCEECLLTNDRFIHGGVISFHDNMPKVEEKWTHGIVETPLSNVKVVTSQNQTTAHSLAPCSVGLQQSPEVPTQNKKTVRSDQKVQHCDATEERHNVASSESAHPPICRETTVDEIFSRVQTRGASRFVLPRQCKSVDQIIAPSLEIASPRRPNSEPIRLVTEDLMQPLVITNRADMENGGDEKGEDVVVVESDGESDSSVTEIVQGAKKRGRNRRCEQATAASITSKKQRIASPPLSLTTKSPSNNNNNGVNCVDDEVEAILSTFNEIEAD